MHQFNYDQQYIKDYYPGSAEMAGQYFMEKLKEIGRDFRINEDFPSYEISYSTLDERSAEAKGAVLFTFRYFFIDGA